MAAASEKILDLLEAMNTHSRRVHRATCWPGRTRCRITCPRSPWPSRPAPLRWRSPSSGCASGKS